MAPQPQYPIILSLPTAGVLSPAARIKLSNQVELIDVTGFLQALTSGPFSVELRIAGVTFATLDWNAAGLVNGNILLNNPDSLDIIGFFVTGVGVGALNCYVTLWVRDVVNTIG